MSNTNPYILIPLQTAVYDAIGDTYEEKSRVEERYMRWGIRIVRRLNQRILKSNKQYAKISIDPISNTFRLPPDIKQPLWQGVISSQGEKVHIPIVSQGWPTEQETEYLNCCDVCGQTKELCEVLNTETKTEVLQPQQIGYPYGCGDAIGFDPVVWQKTEKRTLLPSGSLIVEIETPVWDPVKKTVVVEKVKYVEVVELLNCGCPAPTKENQEAVKRSCGETWEFFRSCCGTDSRERIDASVEYFLEAGYGKVYGNPQTAFIWLEYIGDIPKQNGRYVIPEVAHEAVVAGIKMMANADKRNVQMQEKIRLKREYEQAVKEMHREMGPKLTIDDIYSIIRQRTIP